MTTTTVPGFVYLKKSDYWGVVPSGPAAGLAANWIPTDVTASSEVLFCIPHELTFEVPDDFDPRPVQVATLLKQQADAAAAFAALTTEISRQINELQAIEYVA